MDYNDYGVTYDNYEELLEDRPEVAEALLADVGEGEWQDNQLFFYVSIDDFAEYELTEGWYIDSFGIMSGRRDYNGAPDPLDYIDMKRFGEALLNSGDSSVQWTDWDVVITTSYGW